MNEFTVVAGRPDDVELAALTVALAVALSAAAVPARRETAVPATWTRPARPVAPGSWRARPCRW